MLDTPAWLRRHRSGWRHRGVDRPSFADTPGPGQESVWDYPRPPVWRRDDRRVEVRWGDTVIADTHNAIRVLETASPPTFYLPPNDVDLSCLRQGAGASFCEWKGVARYWDLELGADLVIGAGWSYPEPFPEFDAIKDHLAVYPGVVQCLVDGERVRPQPGGFYGGWVTDDVVGPFKGEPGTKSW